VSLKGIAQSMPLFEGHDVLSFDLNLDQTSLPVALRGLEDIAARLPVLGSRTEL
jgi:hypothetical protein